MLFAEQRNLSKWAPVIYMQPPEIGKDMRVKIAGGVGPKLRAQPVPIDSRHKNLTLDELQKLYGKAAT